MTTLVRAFMGLDLQLKVCEKLLLVQEDLAPILNDRGAAVRWIPATNLHVTLKLFGDIERSLLSLIPPCLETVTRDTEPFRFLTSGIQMFPSGHTPRLIRASITEGADAIDQLRQRLETALEALGFAPDPRPFSASVLLGRVKTDDETVDLSDVAGALNDLPLGRSEVRDVALWISHLTPRGAQFEVAQRAFMATIEKATKTSSRRKRRRRASGGQASDSDNSSS